MAESKVEDLRLPAAVISRIVKDALPSNAAVSKEARTALARLLLSSQILIRNLFLDPDFALSIEKGWKMGRKYEWYNIPWYCVCHLLFPNVSLFLTWPTYLNFPKVWVGEAPSFPMWNNSQFPIISERNVMYAISWCLFWRTSPKYKNIETYELLYYLAQVLRPFTLRDLLSIPNTLLSFISG